MDYPRIVKGPREEFLVRPNLSDYQKLRDEFKWEDLSAELDWFDADHINIAHIAVDTHLKTDRRDKKALIWESQKGEVEEYTFADLSRLSNKFANVLIKEIGVNKGDRIFFFMDRIPEIFIGILGALKAGAVIGPLFSAFGPDAVKDRLVDSRARVLVTSPALKKKVAEIFPDLPHLEKIVIVNRGNVEIESDDLSYESAMEWASEDFETVSTSKDDYAIMHYTSGTTGKPKGAVHAHQAVVGHYATAKYVLDLQPDDIYWCTADPGWVTGTSYGMFGPWSNGITQVVYEGAFSARRWYGFLEKWQVTVWYTAPTAIRMIMRAGDDLPGQFNLDSLRHMCSVGEPLNPEAIMWGQRVLNKLFHDNWWQTETGSIMIANYPVQDIKPGSMGRPFPGITPGIINDEFDELPVGQEGNLALRTPWPSMFRTYWEKENVYQSRFRKGWYITGDRAWMDDEGYFNFVSRADDVINTAGHLVGPFEVESVLMEHPAVAEAGVIGKPDPIAMEIVKAFVSLKEGLQPDEELRDDIMKFAMKRLSMGAAPREIDFIVSLPKTRSGKIMRRLLKAKEMGLPLGDTSTLEED
ncbi:MAG: acetate--CoA ligase [Dehalococcoidales bacterium]|nr:acetate--CoA ligase [Dehalococcoidales bacterium]MDP7524977.1 acetate--CoA ligase [Dehalococcoidales bacterium]